MRTVPAKVSTFIERHRDVLVERWKDKIRATLPTESTLTDEELLDSLQLFLDQIIEGLRTMGGALVEQQYSPLARVHGGQRQALKRSIVEVVQEYSLFLEVVIERARDSRVHLDDRGLLELSKCLFTGAAEAVAQFARQQEEERRRADYEHFAFLAHELRNPLSSARLAYELAQQKGLSDARTMEVMGRSLARLSDLIDESINQARLATLGAGSELHRELVSTRELVAEAQAESAVDAQTKSIQFAISAGADIIVDVDRRLVRSALSNLVRNAVKFTRSGGTIQLRTRTIDERATIDVEDECGGLPPERADRLFAAFLQASKDRSGFGLGLAIARQAIEAHGGAIMVNSLPSKGCIFTIDLPLAGTPDVPGTPGSPGMPDVPGTPGSAGAPGSPDTRPG
jgi:signal transduction histidine kinase